MRLRNTLSDYEYEARLTTESSASSYGQRVLVDTETGEAVDQFSMALTEIIEATVEERAELHRAGYFPMGME